MGAFAAFLLLGVIARAEEWPISPRVGDVYEIRMMRETISQGAGGSSESSDKYALIERVVGVRTDGLELEYDLPEGASPGEKATNWQYPARVFKPFDGPAQLLNASELEARVDGWLVAAGWSRTVCGQWIFTWNAFRIDCDPQSVIKTVSQFDLATAELRAGAPYQEVGALGTGTLESRPDEQGGAIFAVELEIDPEAVRKSRAETDVAVGAIMQKPVTLEAALRARSKDTISGSILISFVTDSTGNARRRIKVIKREIKEPDGRSKTETLTERLERHLISAHH